MWGSGGQWRCAISRRWCKLWCLEYLDGSLGKEEPTVRAIFIACLALAALGDSDGKIQFGSDSNYTPYTDQQIAMRFNIPLKAWLAVKTRLIERESIKVLDDGAIQIVNWRKYQSEYQRQKQYRYKGKVDAKPKEKPRERPYTGH